MLDCGVIDFYKNLQFLNKHQRDYKNISVFSADNLVIGSKEGLNYVNFLDSNLDKILISAETIMKTLNKDKYYSSVESFAVGAIPYTQRHLMWIKFTEENDDDEQEKIALASFMKPSRRCHDIFGDTGQLVDNALFLGDNLLLVDF